MRLEPSDFIPFDPEDKIVNGWAKATRLDREPEPEPAVSLNLPWWAQ